MCLSPIAITVKKTKNKDGSEKARSASKKVFVPCGKCARCESKKRADWAFRMYYENLNQRYGWFVLLTYNEENVPWINYSTGEITSIAKSTSSSFAETDNVSRCVSKKDVQLFIKKLRSQQKYWSKQLNFQNEQIRYFIVSEYGTRQTNRPHYHAIIWGMHPYIADRLQTGSIWKKGFSNVQPLKQDKKAFNYVTKYLYKQKALNKWAVKPFALMSTKPYIGQAFETHGKAYMLENNTIVVDQPNEPLRAIPRIYKDKLSDIKIELARKNILKKIDKADTQLVHTLNKKGNKPLGLIQMEKAAYYQKKYDKELIELNQYT